MASEAYFSRSTVGPSTGVWCKLEPIAGEGDEMGEEK